MKLPGLPKLPINRKALTRAGKKFAGAGEKSSVVSVLVDESADQRLLLACRRFLTPDSQSVDFGVRTFGAQDPPALDKQADLTIVLAGESLFSGRLLETALWSERALVLISPDAAWPLAQVNEADLEQVVANVIEFSLDQDDLEEATRRCQKALAAWIIRHLPQERLSLGAGFAFLRQPVARDLTGQTALENAVLAAVFFLPGADMPALTLNQAKLVYQLAVLNGLPLARERLPELAAVVAGGFGFRALSRLLTKGPAPLNWLVRVALGFLGTLAIGTLAERLYAPGGLLHKPAEQSGALASGLLAPVAAQQAARSPLQERAD